MGIAAENPRMVSFPEALRLLLEIVPLSGIERCPLEQAAGRVLRQVVVADRAFPPFDRVMMDGYALREADWLLGNREFRVTGISPAGQPMGALAGGPKNCVEVMTGAPCPSGADCVVPVEEVAKREGERVTFSASATPVIGKYIHRAGSDAAAASVLLEKGRVLGSREIGTAASCGAVTVEVSKLPRIAIVATGDELVAIDAIPAPHQIRQSNAYSLAAALTRAGYPPAATTVCGDEISIARPILRRLLEENDWLVLTGAVSKGGRDFLPDLLDESGCRKIFHGVAHRPGYPAGCWQGPTGQVIMALPGNPVSALTGLHVFVLPALAVASGCQVPPSRWVEWRDMSLALPEFTRHLPVTLSADGTAAAALTGNSGDFIGLLASDGFVTLPPRGGEGRSFPFTPWI